MDNDKRQTRRHLLRITPALTGMSIVAGCLRLDTSDESSSGDGEESSDTGSDSSQDQSSNDDTQDDTRSEPDDSSSSSDDGQDDGQGETREMNERILSQAESFVSSNEANLYKGQIQDRTGESKVTIETGAGGNGFSFNPSGVAVSTGTTVTFEWTGNGGAHNVVSEDSSDYKFESELTDEQGYTLDIIANDPGTILYVCIPHRAQGMYGAVAVIE
ncbi:halocyanin [Natronomonas moolapensis 8.8.11]|uniref:Halocyanin n=1 Tax=Natronomonas moolapensis (strain DSM 18674 / CECT 7526 / JCM 14361 / 8.8.11) TaxID=268739 RepID=M1Y670_NATM8|nr:halocyanin domain-containing protein [Natronomonas moolapensis]CCQ38056.1 halocyanin [Natronomonas moolapensis 8.8.11]